MKERSEEIGCAVVLVQLYGKNVRNGGND